ncbi:MAG: LLM class flavin-dependent oxidoreductase [Thaumarchaeota archaeon]|nr:LLM class flavin-dependent oxidoreductase [Nitrososphaerota archaeon]
MTRKSMQLGFQGISYGDVDATLQWVRKADEAGFDFLGMPDHLFHPVSDVFLSKPAWDVDAVLGAAAVTTSRIKMMPAVTDTVRRHPATTAHFIATLDRLSHGRAALGIGAGELFNFEPLGNVGWTKPVKRLREAVRLIKALWSATREDPASLEGEFFPLTNGWLGMPPVQSPPPPIYVGGYGPRMKALTAELGDGWLPWLETPETYSMGSATIDAEAAKIGRDPREIDRALELFTVVSRDESEVSKLAERAAIGLAIRHDLLANMGYPDLANESVDVLRANFSAADFKKINSVAARIPKDAVRSVIVGGTPDQVIERIEQYRKAGVRTLILISSTDMTYQNIAAYRDHIIPHFAGSGR